MMVIMMMVVVMMMMTDDQRPYKVWPQRAKQSTLLLKGTTMTRKREHEDDVRANARWDEENSEGADGGGRSEERSSMKAEGEEAGRAEERAIEEGAERVEQGK